MESAVKTRYMGNTTEKDMLLQAELFVRFNGPHILDADPFLRRVAHHLTECGDERGKVQFQTNTKGLLNNVEYAMRAGLIKDVIPLEFLFLYIKNFFILFLFEKINS